MGRRERRAKAGDPAFHIRERRDAAGTLVLALEGDLDGQGAPALAERMAACVAPGGKLVLDFDALDFMDSSGLAALLAAARRANEAGCDVSLVRPQPGLLRIFRVAGMEGMFQVQSGREGRRAPRRLRHDPAPEPDMYRFYTERYVEDERLRMSPHGRLEFARTRELLGRKLPGTPARVLDVGGGTGVHARWLAEDGYEVRLVDVVPEHVEQAAAIAGVSASVGDARDLEQPDDWADVVLLLGPLYHLLSSAERVAALTEARRVARPGGLVAAAAISRYAGLLDLAALGRLDEQTEPLLRDAIATGLHDPRLGFTSAYFHLPDELAGELEEAGLTAVEVYGVEGPTGPALDANGIDMVEDLLPSAIACARVVERDPALIAASAHLLAFGRA